MSFILYRIYMTNAALGATNPAIETFHIDAAGEVDSLESSAQLLAFCCYGSKAANTAFQAITREVEGGSGAVQLPFPIAAFGDLAADNSDLPSIAAYGDEFGSGNLTPVGVSITLSLYSAIPGRKTTGRTYTPFVSSAAITADGLVGGAQRTAVEDAYTLYLLGLTSGPVPPPASLIPLVYSKTDDTTTPIVTPKASVRPSRLKTRTR